MFCFTETCQISLSHSLFLKKIQIHLQKENKKEINK